VSDTSHDRAGEYQCVATVDAEGYVVSMSATRTKTADFYKALKALPRYPMIDVVYPTGWPVDFATGRGWSVLEVRQQNIRTTYDLPNEEAA
jgi:hypothetical protein